MLVHKITKIEPTKVFPARAIEFGRAKAKDSSIEETRPSKVIFFPNNLLFSLLRSNNATKIMLVMAVIASNPKTTNGVIGNINAENKPIEVAPIIVPESKYVKKT